MFSCFISSFISRDINVARHATQGNGLLVILSKFLVFFEKNINNEFGKSQPCSACITDSGKCLINIGWERQAMLGTYSEVGYAVF